MATANLGLYQLPVTSPDYEGGASPVALISASLAVLDAQKGVQVAAASGAISIKEGVVVITKASDVAQMTLAKPAAGLPAAGKDDGKLLRVVSTTAQAHTVITPASGINGASTTLTFAAAGDYCELVAYNGSWWLLAHTPTNVVLS